MVYKKYGRIKITMRNHIIAQHVAIEEALRSEHEIKHGAVLVKNGKIINSSRNQHCTLRRVKSFTQQRIWSIHAEMNVLHGIPKSVTRGCDLYVVRVTPYGIHKFMNSKPCGICSALCQKAGIRKVYYSVEGI